MHGTHDIPFNTTMSDFTTSCSGTSLSGIRIGVPRNAFPRGSVLEHAFIDALGTLTQAGAKIIDTNLLTTEEYANWAVSEKEATICADIVGFEQHIATEGGIAGAIERSKVDVLAVPSTADTAKKFSAIEGSPSVSVPLGSLPIETRIKKATRPGDLIEESPNLP